MQPRAQLWRFGWTLAALAATACSAMPPGKLELRPVASAGTARLILRLDGLFGRQLLYAASGPKLKITIDGPDLTKPFETTASLGSGDTLVTLEQVPIGARRLITAQSLTSDGLAITSAVARAVVELKAGANSVALSPAATAVGEVATAVLASDRTNKTQLFSKLDLAALTEAVNGYARSLKARHPSLLNTEAIAKAITDGGGTLPAASAAFVAAPGKVVVKATDTPPGVSFTLSLDDPVSQPAGLAGDEAAVIEPVAPGQWTLTLTPDAPGLAPKKVGVNVGAGGTVNVSASFVGTAAKPDLDLPLAPGGSATVSVNGQPMLVAIGGTTYNDADGPQNFRSVATYTAAGGWALGAGLNTPLLEPAVTAYNGKVYWFGGHNGSGHVSTGGVYTPGAPGTIQSTAAMPGNVAVRGGNAAAIGDKIYVTGGVGDGPGLEQVLTYTPATNSWASQPIEALLPGVRNMASAVVDGRWYFFGGAKPGDAWANGGLMSALAPQNKVTVFTPGPPVSWAVRRSMPTARAGASTVVVAGKVWVIGGVETLGLPSRAVEIYDPATDTWTVRSPLREGRAAPAVGLFGGKILVAGGMSGNDVFDSLAIASVEEITP